MNELFFTSFQCASEEDNDAWFKERDRIRNQLGECPELKELYEKIARANLYLIQYMAKRRLGWGIDFGDLEEIGNGVLSRAVENFRLGRISFKSWLCTCIDRAIIDECRKRRRSRHYVYQASSIVDEHVGGETPSAEKCWKDILSLNCLYPQERKILRLFLLGHTVEEISEQTSLAKKTVYWIKSQAVCKLRHNDDARRIYNEYRAIADHAVFSV